MQRARCSYELLVTLSRTPPSSASGIVRSCEAFHTRKLTLARRRDGARLFRDDVLRGLGSAKRSLTRWLSGASDIGGRPDRTQGIGTRANSPALWGHLREVLYVQLGYQD